MQDGTPNVLATGGSPVRGQNRRSIRLQGYDYSRAGAYFVTICTQNRECLFGDIVHGEMRLNDAGRVVADEWLKTAEIRTEIELDAWVVMPNHFHGILVIACRGTACRARDNDNATLGTAPTTLGTAPTTLGTAPTTLGTAPTTLGTAPTTLGTAPTTMGTAPTTMGTARRAPTVERFGGPVSGSVPTIVRAFKSAVTKRINELRQSPGAKLWQRNYWEHIVRNEPELIRIREYIRNNPARWEWDQLCPARPDEIELGEGGDDRL